jgi:hypothetical protein
MPSTGLHIQVLDTATHVWAAAVSKWTHPLVTVEKVRDVAGDIVREQEDSHIREAVAPTHS